MIIVTDSKKNEDNRSWTNIFQNTIYLSPHSRIALTSASIPLQFIVVRPVIDIDEDINDIFTIGVRWNGNPAPAAPRNTVSIQIPAGTYSIDQLISTMNDLLASIPINDAPASPISMFASVGIDSNGYFYVSFGTSIYTPAVVVPPLTVDIQFTTLSNQLGFFFESIAPTPPATLFSSAFTGSDGYVRAVRIMPLLLQAYEDLTKNVRPLYIGLPSFMINTPISGSGGLTNSKQIAHVIFYNFGLTVSFSDYLFNLLKGENPPSTVPNYLNKIIIDTRLNYLPPLHQYVEINNDTVTPVNDMLVTIFDEYGGINEDVNNYGLPIDPLIKTQGRDNRVILTWELETEPEANQEALRQVKNKIRVDKFLKAAQHNLPL